MANILFQTYLSPYRIDTYNAFHEQGNMNFYFLNRKHGMQNFDMDSLYAQCSFTPCFLKTIPIFNQYYKFCTNIWSILSFEKPNVVIVPEFKILTLQVLLYKFLFFKKFKVISMCDDSYDMVSNNHDFSIIHRWARKLVVPLLDNLLLVDSRVTDWYKKHYMKGIWLPIIRDDIKESKLYKSVLPLSAEFAKKFDLINKKVLLFVGRLDPVKNLDRLLEAISNTKEEFITVIVGNGELEEKLKGMSKNINKPIVFAGRYEGDAVRAWYNIADVFILPSKQEAFGAVTNEALIAGLPCIVSRNAGSACLIYQTNGYVVDPYNVPEMASVIDHLFQRIETKNLLFLRSSKMTLSFDDTIKRCIAEFYVQ